MPLGIVSNEEYEKNLPEKEGMAESSNDSISEESQKKNEEGVETIEILSPQIGRGKGNTEVPQILRKIIGESSIEEGSSAAQAIGKFLGLSQSSISAYAKGATSTATYNQPNVDLVSHLNKTRQRIIKRAQGKLFKSLDVIDESKLNELDALQASTVAKNMSAIVKNMEPPDNKGTTVNGPVITFYAPTLVREEIFEVVNANEV